MLALKLLKIQFVELWFFYNSHDEPTPDFFMVIESCIISFKF